MPPERPGRPLRISGQRRAPIFAAHRARRGQVRALKYELMGVYADGCAGDAEPFAAKARAARAANLLARLVVGLRLQDPRRLFTQTVDPQVRAAAVTAARSHGARLRTGAKGRCHPPTARNPPSPRDARHDFGSVKELHFD
jgi:hypothetical protein